MVQCVIRCQRDKTHKSVVRDPRQFDASQEIAELHHKFAINAHECGNAHHRFVEFIFWSHSKHAATTSTRNSCYCSSSVSSLFHKQKTDYCRCVDNKHSCFQTSTQKLSFSQIKSMELNAFVHRFLLCKHFMSDREIEVLNENLNSCSEVEYI